MKWMILLAGIAANASASILIKIAVTPPRSMPSLADINAAIHNWPFWLGLFFYGVALLLYTAALAKLPLNIAHPILTSGAIASVAVASFFFFKEEMSTLTLAGIALVVAGVVLISLQTH